MCFYAYTKEQATAKRATEDIVCYKTLYIIENNNIFKSVVKGFIYRLGTTYKEWFIKLKRDNKGEYYNGNCWYGNRGFHSFIEPLNWVMEKNEVMIKCIIPKGTKYYTNKSEYFSSRIKIIEVIK